MPVRYVLDTHALVWFLEGNPRLSVAARAVIADVASDLVLPLIALAEAAFIVERGRTSIPNVADLLRRVQQDQRIELYPRTVEVFRQSLTAASIPEMHDRLIVGTALYLQTLGHVVEVLTRDGEIRGSGLVQVRW